MKMVGYASAFALRATADKSPNPPNEAYLVSCRERLRKARASGPHILIITMAQEAKPTKANMTMRAISMSPCIDDLRTNLCPVSIRIRRFNCRWEGVGYLPFSFGGC